MLFLPAEILATDLIKTMRVYEGDNTKTIWKY